jgi:hypothetical protein
VLLQAIDTDPHHRRRRLVIHVVEIDQHQGPLLRWGEPGQRSPNVNSPDNGLIGQRDAGGGRLDEQRSVGRMEIGFAGALIPTQTQDRLISTQQRSGHPADRGVEPAAV